MKPVNTNREVIDLVKNYCPDARVRCFVVRDKGKYTGNISVTVTFPKLKWWHLRTKMNIIALKDVVSRVVDERFHFHIHG